MKKLFPAVVCFAVIIFMCGCTKARPISVYCGKYSAIATIKTVGNCYKYKYNFQGIGNCSFEALDKYPYIDFCWNSNICSLSCNNIITKIGDSIDSSFPAIIKYIVENNQNTKAVKDYNGIYAIHGSSDFGEYCLVLNENGTPKSITAKSIDLSIEFEDIILN